MLPSQVKSSQVKSSQVKWVMLHIQSKSNEMALLTWEKEEALKRAIERVKCCVRRGRGCLTTKSVQGAALALQSIHHIHGGDSFPLGMLGVGDSITDDILQENLENATCLFVDQARDTLDTTTTCQTTDGRLGDALDVVTEHFSVPLGSPLSQSLSSFTTARHFAVQTQ